MSFSRRKICCPAWNPFGRRSARAGWLAVVVMLMAAQSSASAQRPEARRAAVAKVKSAEKTSAKSDRRKQRMERADDRGGPERRRQRSSPNRAGRGGRRDSRRPRAAGRSGAEQRPRAAAQEQGGLHLSGSFDLGLGKGNAVRGEGSMTVEIDRETAAKLHALVGDGIEGAGPMATDLLPVIGGLPETIASTVEILKILADPETQQNLRQVEQVLRLLQVSQDAAGLGK